MAQVYTAEYFKAEGKRGGRKAKALSTPAERSERAKKASQARWGKKVKPKAAA